MMIIEEIKQELATQDKNPNDYIIITTENGHSAVPKNKLIEVKWTAQREDKPIIKDVNDVAELTTMVAMDKDDIAEMLVYALQRIDELEGKING